MNFAWATILTIIVMEIRSSVLQQVFQMTAIYDDENEEWGFFLNGTDYKSFITSYALCWLECEEDKNCMSLNYDTMTEKCYLNSQNKRTAPASYIQKNNNYYRTIAGRKPWHWSKLNGVPVCFGAKDSDFGVVNVMYTGKVTRLKLVHISGYVSSNGGMNKNNWGTHDYWFTGQSYLATILTDNNNVKILPDDAMIKKSEICGYRIPGYNIYSPEIVLNVTTTFHVKSGDEYRLWYGEDLKNKDDSDNKGRACVDVYMYGTFDY